MIKRIILYFQKLVDRIRERRLIRKIAKGASNLEKAAQKKEMDEAMERMNLIMWLRKKLSIKSLNDHHTDRLAAAKSAGKYGVRKNRLVKL